MASNQAGANGTEEQADELVIRVSGAALPDGEQERETILQDLGRQVGRILSENHGIHADSVSGDVGPQYTQIGDDCPVCEHSGVELRDYTYTDSGAAASAFCPECEWRGTAVYRLIDYEDRRPGNGRRSENWRSAVASDRKTAHYHGY
jgi:hypothetical protein